LVSYCSQQRGYPGIPLLQYTMADFHREFHTVKKCAPFCTVGCVHRISVADRYFIQLAPSPKQEVQNNISSS
jgi:predicted molibdopterin-dependent oxidoreductase YjgC